MASANGSPAVWAGANVGDDARYNYADWVTFQHRHDLLLGSDAVTNTSGIAVNEMVFSSSLVGVHPETIAVPMIRRIQIPNPFNTTDATAGDHIARITRLRVVYYRDDSSQIIVVRLRKYDSSAGTISDVLSYSTASGDFSATGILSIESKSGAPLATVDMDDTYFWEVNLTADTVNTRVFIRDFEYDLEKRAVE